MIDQYNDLLCYDYYQLLSIGQYKNNENQLQQISTLQKVQRMQIQQKSILSYFTDYLHISEGLKKLDIQHPLDFQQQLLEIEQPLDNLIICAQEGSGKLLAIVLLALKKFFNQEQGILCFVCHSKQLSQNVHYLLSTLSKIDTLNLYMKKIDHLASKAVLIGNPTQLYNIQKKYKEKVIQLIIPQADILFSFGYGASLEQLVLSLNHGISYKMTCVEKSEELMGFKEKHMKKTIKIDYEPPETAVEATAQQPKTDEMITHFYSVGQRIIMPISLYVSIRFSLVNPKILVLCENLKQVYRYYMMLERSHIHNIGLYNHQNPINLKFYTLALWMKGNVNVLVATAKIIDDINSNIFKDNCIKTYKKKTFELFNMTTIITINLKHLEGYYDHMIDLFHSKPFVMTFLENKDQEITALRDFIKFEEQKFTTVKKKEFPITRKELDAFKYRIQDLWAVLGNHKVELYQQLDFKKKMLRSPDLKSYFAQNLKEKEVLVKEINRLRKKIDSDGVRVPEFVSQYLVPECLKTSYKQKMQEMAKNAKQNTSPEYQKKVQRVLKHIEIEDENPQTTDVSRLKLVSARKRWKLQHGFKLKKRNIRNQRKGIFQSNS